MNIGHATHIDVEAEVRYWEDAAVNGVEDSDGELIPGKQGDLWKVRIDLLDGIIEDWPADTVARIHYKVCDQGEYWLTDASGERVAKWRGAYVPSAFLCHGSEGYGDYIIMDVEIGGGIVRYEMPKINPEEWQPIERQPR